jgi:hypothetical protein
MEPNKHQLSSEECAAYRARLATDGEEHLLRAIGLSRLPFYRAIAGQTGRTGTIAALRLYLNQQTGHPATLPHTRALRRSSIWRYRMSNDTPAGPSLASKNNALTPEAILEIAIALAEKTPATTIPSTEEQARFWQAYLSFPEPRPEGAFGAIMNLIGRLPPDSRMLVLDEAQRLIDAGKPV